jgi:cyanate permease
LYEPAYVTINAWFETQRQSALLTLTVVAGLACTIFVPVSAALISHLGWRTALLILAAVELATVVPHGFFLRRRPADVGWRRDSLHEVKGTPAPLVPVRPESPPPQYSPVSDRLAGTLWSRPVAMLTAGSILGAAAIAAVSVLLLSYLSNRGFSLAVAAAATGALGVVQVFGRILLTVFAHRITTTTATALMLGLQAVGVAALLLISNLAGVVLFVLLFGAGYGVLSIARPDLLARYAARRFFAQVSGIQALLVIIGEALGPTGGAILHRATGSYTLVFVTVAFCSLAAALLFLGASRAYRQAERRHLSAAAL